MSMISGSAAVADGAGFRPPAAFGQGTEEFAVTVSCAGRNELAESVFAQPAESQSVHKACEDHDPGMGDERLAGERDRDGRENTARLDTGRVLLRSAE